MAKKTEQAPTNFLHNRWILFIAGVLLLSGAYWLKQWPLLGFIALIPCFALAEHPKANEKIWELTELLLFIFGISLYVGFQFEIAKIFSVVGLALCFTLPFILFVLSRIGGGPLTVNFLIVIYWLAVEYLLLKLLTALHLDPGTMPVFIADLMMTRPEWLKWNLHAGYLAVSAWILISNWLGYLLISKPFRWIILILLFVVIASPIIYSLLADTSGITRSDVISLYTTGLQSDSAYSQYGEWIGRTSAWVSVLVLLFSMIRYKTKKK